MCRERYSQNYRLWGEERRLLGISAGRGQEEELICDSGGFKKKIKLKGWIREIKPWELEGIFRSSKASFQHFHIHYDMTRWAVWWKRSRVNMILACTYWSHKKMLGDYLFLYSLFALLRRGKDHCNLFQVVWWRPWALEVGRHHELNYQLLNKWMK